MEAHYLLFRHFLQPTYSMSSSTCICFAKSLSNEHCVLSLSIPSLMDWHAVMCFAMALSYITGTAPICRKESK